MAYIGTRPTIGNFVKLDTITTSATTTFNLLSGGVAYSPQSANHCIVSLNGVIQSPNTSFTISGSTIVFASTLSASDVIDFILVLGDVLNIGTPSDATVGFSKITSNLITGATAETSIDGADSILIYDDSATALRKMTRTNFVAGIGATAGQVIQVVSATHNTPVTTTSNSFVTSNLSVSITPSSASNKILILASAVIATSGTATHAGVTIYRGATNLSNDTDMAHSYGDAGSVRCNIGLHYLDSPATTSSTTYAVYFRAGSGAHTQTIHVNDSMSSITVLEVKG